MQSFLGGQQVVQKAEEEAVVHGVKTRDSAKFPSRFPVGVMSCSFRLG